MFNKPFFFSQNKPVVASGFSPLDISGLQLWLKADSLSNSDGDVLATFPDSSGNGRDFTKSYAPSRPTYKTNILNGKPALKFVAANGNEMTLSSLPTMTAATWFVVYITISNHSYEVFGTKAGNSSYLHYSGDGSGYSGAFRTTRLTSYPSSTPIVGIHILTGRSNSSFFELLIDNISKGVQSAGYNTGDLWSLGVNADISNTYLDGYIPEVIVCDSDLSQTITDNVMKYLQSKYGLSNNYGTLLNGATWSADVPSPISANVNSLSFDGADDKVTFGRDIILNDTGAISFWFRTTSFNSGMILGNTAISNDISLDSPTAIYIYGSSAYGFTVPSMSTNTWYNVTIVNNGGSMRLYLNGTESSTGAVSTSGIFTFNQMGARQSAGYPLSGKIADVRIFSDILSSADIAAIYAGTIPSATPLSYWKLNEGDGILVKDYGIYDYDADKYIKAIYSGGDTLTPQEVYATYEIFIGMKADLLM